MADVPCAWPESLAVLGGILVGKVEVAVGVFAERDAAEHANAILLEGKIALEQRLFVTRSAFARALDGLAAGNK